MTDEQAEIPLQQIIYKPTTENSTIPKANQPWKTKNYSLYLIAFIANLLSFATGSAISWITPILPKIDGSRDIAESPFGRSITTSEMSWIVGLMPLGATIGPLLAGKSADKFGRKGLLLALGCIAVLSLAITMFAKTVLLFYVARFLAGFSLGGVFNILPMFLVEISESHNRGALGCSVNIFVAMGVNFSLIIGPYLSISKFSFISLIPLLIFIPAFFALSPESPTFLAFNNDDKGLEASLLKLRNKNSDELHQELTNILEISRQNARNKGGLSELLSTKYLRKSLIISLVLMSLQQSVGFAAVLSYMQTIFEAAKVNFPSEVCIMLVGTAQIIGTVISTLIVDRAGRKILLLISCVGTCITIAALGLFFKLKNNSFDVEGLSWLPLASLIVYIVCFGVGLGPVPWVVMAELFPSSVRSLAATLSSFTCFLITFIVAVTFPFLSMHLGMANCFFLFSFFPLIGTMFIYWVLPETKGKSLQEIQKLL